MNEPNIIRNESDDDTQEYHYIEQNDTEELKESEVQSIRKLMDRQNQVRQEIRSTKKRKSGAIESSAKSNHRYSNGNP